MVGKGKEKWKGEERRGKGKGREREREGEGVVGQRRDRVKGGEEDVEGIREGTWPPDFKS